MGGKSDSEEIEIELDFKSLKKFSKKYLPVILLALFILYGGYLRFYHINYPMIGFHNWKSAHYITEARNFAEEGFFKHGFFVPMRDTLGSIDEPPDGAHKDTFPLISIIVGLLISIFGESLALARLPNIIFSLTGAVFMYLLIKELFDREGLALISAFLFSVNPLFVFFSHNVQMINPALGLMMAGFYFYVRWVKTKLSKGYYLYAASFLIMLAAATKYTFAIAAFPILISFPYKKIFRKTKKYSKDIIVSAFIAMGFPAWFLYSEIIVKGQVTRLSPTGTATSSNLLNLVDFGILTDMSFWEGALKSFIADNYSLIGALFFLLGVVLFTFFSIRKSKKKYYRYFMTAYLFLVAVFGFSLLLLVPKALFNMKLPQILNIFTGFLFLTFFSVVGLIFHVVQLLQGKKVPFYVNFLYGYLAGLILFIFIMGFKLSGHNYHQFPVAPLVIFFVSYFIVVISRSISKMLPEKDMGAVLFIVIVLFMIFVFPLNIKASLFTRSMAAKDRMFDAQFPGLDIAGEYMRQHSQPGDRMFHSSGQNYGVLWHADMTGYKPPANKGNFTEAEENFNVNWVFVYQWGMKNYCVLVPKEQCSEKEMNRYDYLKDNYRLVQFGFRPGNNQVIPLYLLFRRGGSFNESQINNILAGGQQGTWNYAYTHTPYQIGYINLE